MKNIVLALALIVSASLTSCSWFEKDKPGDITGEPLPGQYNDELITDNNVVPPLDALDSGDMQTIDTGAQEELIAVAGDRVFFGYDSYSLNMEAKDTLRKQISWLMQNPNSTVTIEGHCDERGTREYNLALGERRANSVKDFLIQNGVTLNRVNVISYGKEFPEFLGSNPEAWGKNRRAVTVIN